MLSGLVENVGIFKVVWLCMPLPICARLFWIDLAWEEMQLSKESFKMAWKPFWSIVGVSVAYRATLSIWQTRCSRGCLTNSFVIKYVPHWSFVKISSKHRSSQTKRVRDLTFWENVHPTRCHVSENEILNLWMSETLALWSCEILKFLIKELFMF